jgi:hypothetical protein
MSGARITVAAIKADATMNSLIAGRIWPFDRVPKSARRPWIAYSVESNQKDKDLGGTELGWETVLRLEVVANTAASCEAVRDRIDPVIDAIQDTTVAGCPVEATDTQDDGDGVNGPVDLDDGQAFTASVSVSIFWRRG